MFTWFDHSTGGEITITPSVRDVGTSWSYLVNNINYNPPGGNGLSGFTLGFTGPLYVPGTSIPLVFNNQAPGPGWIENCCAGPQADVVEFDKPSGMGILPGQQGVFAFDTLPRKTQVNPGGFFTSPGGWAHTWISGRQSNIFYGANLMPGDNKIGLLDTISTALGIYLLTSSVAAGAVATAGAAIATAPEGGVGAVLPAWFTEQEAIGLATLGIGVYKIIDDPPDPNFSEAVSPTFLLLPRVTAGPNIPSATADTANAATDAAGQVLAFLGASATSLDRVTSARIAGDGASAVMQLKAFDSFLGDASGAMADQARLDAQFLNDVRETGFPNVAVTGGAVTMFQDMLQTNGFPADENSILDAAGITPSVQSELINQLAGLDPQAASGNIFDLGSKLDAAQKQLSDLIGISAESHVPVPVPEPPTFWLVVVGIVEMIMISLLSRRRKYNVSVQSRTLLSQPSQI